MRDEGGDRSSEFRARVLGLWGGRKDRQECVRTDMCEIETEREWWEVRDRDGQRSRETERSRRLRVTKRAREGEEWGLGVCRVLSG